MRFLAVFLISLIIAPGIADAACDFKTSDFLERMRTPSEIKGIKVTIPKSRKFMMNSLRVLVTRDPVIKQKYKDKFEAFIEVQYQFGRCEYEGTLRQTGDLKDHVRFVGDRPAPSLNVSLDDGNIMSAVKFKLLIPESRNGLNEILGSLIFRQLGFIAPETFAVTGSINGTEAEYIWQERAAKEMLERNFRREGPIFEGDETMFWLPGGSHRRAHLGIRQENDNWAAKGDTSFEISFQAFLRLQAELLPLADDGHDGLGYINPNRFHERSLFPGFNLVMLAMGGMHGLVRNNRKYYFNAMTNAFEPIYYDGDFTFPTNFDQWVRRLPQAPATDLQASFARMSDGEWAALRRRVRDLDMKELTRRFRERSAMQGADAGEFVEARVRRLQAAFEDMDAMHREAPAATTDTEPAPELSDIAVPFMNAAQESGVPQRYARIGARTGDGFEITCIGTPPCAAKQVSRAEVIQLMEDNRFEKVRTLIVGGPSAVMEEDAGTTTETPVGSVLHSPSASVSFSDRGTPRLVLTQARPDDWFLISGVELSSLQIELAGVPEAENAASGEQAQRFNHRGLTGCLTLHDARLAAIEIDASQGGCEDSINVISSSGTIAAITVHDAAADALDIDFSELDIGRVRVSDAANDCLDFSSGIYRIGTVDAEDCGDKGVSVGERSSLRVDDRLHVAGSDILISSKDSSLVSASVIVGSRVRVCLDAHKKKQEFNGAVLRVGSLDCSGIIQADGNSRIHVGETTR